MNLTEKLAYLAGCLDCDGTINFSLERKDKTVYITIRVFVVSSFEPEYASYVQNLLKEIFPHVKLHHSWSMSGTSYRVGLTKQEEVKRFLELIYPYLALKKRRAEIALTILKNKPMPRQTLLSLLRELARLNFKKGTSRKQWARDWLNETVDYRCPWFASEHVEEKGGGCA